MMALSVARRGPICQPVDALLNINRRYSFFLYRRHVDTVAGGESEKTGVGENADKLTD